MKVFLTGGSGFVGQHLIADLIDRGCEVLALARSQASASKVISKGAEALIGDLTALSNESLHALKQCDFVVHSAAHMDFTYDRAPFYNINVKATKTLLQRAQSAGIKKFVYISAAPVVPGSPIINLSEDQAGEGLPKALYPKTKAIAEREVMKANSTEFLTISLRPPAIWGPDNHHLDELFSMAREGKWRWIGGGHHILSTIHVRNLSAAVWSALQSEKGGEAYFVTDGDRRSMRETFSSIMKANGIDPGDQELPRGVAVIAAHLLGGIWKTFGFKSRPPVAPIMIRLMGTEFSVNDEKARRDLGYQPVIDFAGGIAEMKAKHLS